MIVSEAPPINSGVARVTEEICKRLRSRGHTIDIVSSNNIPRIELGEVRLSSMLWNGIGPVLQRLKQYDLVHIHGSVPTFSDVALVFAALMRILGGPAIVYTHHCDIELPGKELICAPYNFTHRALARLADHVVVSTPSYANLFTPFVPADRIGVIPWGVNAAQDIYPKSERFHILFVGQMRPYKGLEVLLRAFQRINNATLTVIGSGHRAEYYRAFVEQLGLNDVRFLGKVSEEELRQAYAEAHVVVLPSISKIEAFGLVLLEGMAHGCVPIASRLPGLLDVVDTVGYTFTPGDDRELTSILTMLQDSPDTISRLSQAARWRASHFSWDTTALAYEQLFLALKEGRKNSYAEWDQRYNYAHSINNAERHLWPTLPATRTVSHLPHIPRTIRMMFDDVVKDFQASYASLMLWDLAADCLVLAMHKGLDDVLIGLSVPIKESVAGWVAKEGKPLFVDEAHMLQEIRPYISKPEISSALSVPIKHDEVLLGVLNLARSSPEDPYTSTDLHRLTITLQSWHLPRERAIGYSSITSEA